MNNTYNNIDDNYQALNNKVFNNFLDKYFFKNWREKGAPYEGLEIIFSPKCNLKCSYCYVHKNNKKIYDENWFDLKTSLKNVVSILKWLGDNKMSPPIDIFSGELFAQKSGYELLETIISFYESNNYEEKPPCFIIPTNGSFLNDKQLTERIISYKKRFKEQGIDLYLSFSFDGYYCDKITRRFKKEIDLPFQASYTEDFYETIFQFMSKYGDLPHPMVASENVAAWKDNFLWFEKMFDKYNIPIESLYLLEVRNYNWDEKTLKEFSDFLSFLVHHMFERYNYDKEKFSEWMTRKKENIHRGFNILGTVINRNDSGSSCTFGRQLMVRASDLKMFPCHRLAYPELEIGHFSTENNEFKFITKQAELGIVTSAVTANTMNICNSCNIKFLCIGQCFGSCYEVLNDMFTPIPSVCNLEYVKVKTVISSLKEIGVLDQVINKIENKQVLVNLLNFIDKEL